MRLVGLVGAGMAACTAACTAAWKTTGVGNSSGWWDSVLTAAAKVDGVVVIEGSSGTILSCVIASWRKDSFE